MESQEEVCPGYICSGLSLQSSFHFSSDGAIEASTVSVQIRHGLGQRSRLSGPGSDDTSGTVHSASASAVVQSG